MRRITLCIILLAATLLPAAAQSPFEMREGRLSRDTILIGDRVDWTMEVEIGRDETIFFEKPDDVPVAGLETVVPLTLDTLSMKKNLVKIEAKVVLTCFDSGSYYLPNLLAFIERKDGRVDTLMFDSPVVEVTTIPIDTATYVIKDIKGPIKYPITFKELLPWIGGTILLALLIWLLVRLIISRRENKTLFGKPVVKDPAHIVALRSLEKIRGQKLWQNNKQKQFYTSVTDTLRVYIAERFGIATMERPSGEMLADLKKTDVEPRLYDEMNDLFSRADMVKFAKYEASDDQNEEVIPTAVRFVNSTFLQELEDEKGKKEE